MARYYDSRTGTFLMTDPVAGKPGDPQSWNRYVYVRDNPIMITDPSGQSWWSDLIGVGLWASTFFTGGATTELAEAYTYANSMSDAGSAFSHGHYAAGVFDLGLGITAGAGLAAANGSPAGGGSGSTPPMRESLGFPNYGAFAKMTAGSAFQAIGNLHGTPGCEFGACGAGPSAFGPGGPSQGPNPLSVTSGAISVSAIFPIFFGVLGPAVTVSYDPKNHLLCGGVGAGLSAGHTVGGGPVVVHAKPGNTSKDVLGGWSLSGGYNWTPWWGYQGSVNGSGYTAGYSFGVPGASGSATYSWCRQGGG